jgi:hypothetical protein
MDSYPKTDWSARTEYDISIFTNDVNMYNAMCAKFTVIERWEPDLTNTTLDTPNVIAVKKLPYGKYRFKVFLKPHKILDPTEKQEYIKWSDRVLVYEAFVCQPAIAMVDLLKPKRILGHYSNVDEILSLAESVIGDGEEGIIARAYNEKARYAIKNENHFKVKSRIELDLLIVAVENTFGEKGNPGLVLKLCDTARNEYKVACNIDKYIANSSDLVGKVAMIRAMEKLRNGSLRQPTFVCLRNDKKSHEID